MKRKMGNKYMNAKPQYQYTPRRKPERLCNAAHQWLTRSLIWRTLAQHPEGWSPRGRGEISKVAFESADRGASGVGCSVGIPAFATGRRVPTV